MSELRGIQANACFLQKSSFSLFNVIASRDFSSMIRCASSVIIEELVSELSRATIDEFSTPEPMVC
jgi:hypothetical protein